MFKNTPRHPEHDSGSVLSKPRFLVKPGWRKKNEHVFTVNVKCEAAGEAVVDVVAKYNPCPRPEGREFMGDGIVPPAGL